MWRRHQVSGYVAKLDLGFVHHGVSRVRLHQLLAPIDSRRGGITRAVVGLGKPIEPQNRCLPGAELKFRIHSPPAANLRTIGSSAAKEPYNGLRDHLPTKRIAVRLREIMQAHPQAGSRKPLVHVVQTQVVIGLDKIAAAPG